MDNTQPRFETPGERKLLEGCLSQDKGSWDTFVDNYSRLISHAIVQTLRKYCFEMDNQLVDDLFHIAFLSLIENNCKKLRQFQWKCKLSSWLHMIAVRVTIDYLRKHSELPSINGETDEEKYIKSSIRNGNPLPSELVEMEEEKRIFEQIKEKLTSRECLFVELYYCRELPPTEVAVILNTTANNIYQLKNKVREKMKKIAKKLL